MGMLIIVIMRTVSSMNLYFKTYETAHTGYLHCVVCH